MKTFKYYLIFSFALIFVQCKEKADPKSTPTIDQEEQMIPTEVQDTISVTVYDNNNRTLGNVVIEILQKGVSIGQVRTNSNGNATLTTVETANDYTFSKDSFHSQSIRFMDFNNLHGLNVYLKPNADPSSPVVNISGIVSNTNGQVVNNVTIRSNTSSTVSQQDGSYSLDIRSQEVTFPITYIQGDISGALRMKVNQDTILVDVFIDGFTNDTTSTKSEK